MKIPEIQRKQIINGSCVKRMRSWMGLVHGREWHESMIILGPEQHPETVIESRPTLTLGALDGTIRKYNWMKVNR